MIRSDTGYVRQINSIFIAAGTIILLIAIWQIRSVLLLALAAVLLAVLFSMPVRLFMRVGMNRPLAIIASIVLATMMMVLAFIIVLPTLVQQFNVLFSDVIPEGVDRIIEWWNSGVVYEQFPFLETALSNMTIDSSTINQIVGQVSNALGQLGGSVVPLVGGVASALISTLIVLFVCLYLIAEPDRYIKGLVRLSPIWYRNRVLEILSQLDRTIRAWLRVTGASMLFTGIGTAIGLALIGIEQWAALAVLTGVLSFIPNFGPIMAVIPSVAVAMIQAPEYTLVVIIIIYGVSFIQSQIIGPLLASGNMNLAPVLILIGQIVFGVFFGFLGLMLAVPLTAIFVVLVSEIYVEDMLGDHYEAEPEEVAEIENQRMVELLPETD